MKWSLTEDSWRRYFDEHGSPQGEVEERNMYIECINQNGSFDAELYNKHNGELAAHKIIAKLQAEES